MAAQITEILVSDLSGTEIADGGGTIEFTISGQAYAVDLTAHEIAAFNDALGPYLAVARRARAKRPAPHKPPTTGAGRHSKEQLQAIRSWARGQGHSVGDRGRIPIHIVEEYNQSH